LTVFHEDYVNIFSQLMNLGIIAEHMCNFADKLLLMLSKN